MFGRTGIVFQNPISGGGELYKAQWVWREARRRSRTAGRRRPRTGVSLGHGVRLPHGTGAAEQPAILHPDAPAGAPTPQGRLEMPAGYRPGGRPQAAARICYAGTMTAPRTHAHTHRRGGGGVPVDRPFFVRTRDVKCGLAHPFLRPSLAACDAVPYGLAGIACHVM